MLSKGLPPPLLVLPDLIDSASAGDVLVLLADVDSACDVAVALGGGGALTIGDVRGVDSDCIVDSVVLCFVGGAGVVRLVASLEVDALVGSSVVFVVKIDCDVGIGNRGIVVLTPKPVVVVTTATLHSTCIALPSLKSPTMLVSATSAAWQLLATSALTWTNPSKQALEHTDFWKSSKVHPAISWE